MNTTQPRSPRHPPPWFVHTAWRVHRALYRLSGGRFLWTTSNKRGWGALRLTTIGRTSGQERNVIIGYLEDGPNLVTLAMNGFDEGHPSWWLNLEAHPDAVVRLAHQPPRSVRARRAAGEERERLWQRWVAVDQNLDAHAGRRTTPTPVVVLEPRQTTPNNSSTDEFTHHGPSKWVMRRAVELFALARQSSTSTFLDETWWTRSAPAKSFLSVAGIHWEMVVTWQRGAAGLTVRGPETKATIVAIPEDAEFFGIRFSLGTFIPSLPPAQVVDRALTLPQATSTSFWLDGSAWELPGPDNADVFVDRLVRAGLLVHDPVASGALRGDVEGLSRRSVERRVSRATGLTGGTIRQIRRAEGAVELLSRGVSAIDAARQAGYADQPHLSRSLKRFVGLTPSQIGTSAVEPT